jgi:Tol biopolymer transport system component
LLISLSTEERQVLGSCYTPSESAILDWSADGAMLAYVDIGKDSSSPGIWLMRLSDGQRRQLSDPADAYQFDTRPRFGPDGSRLSFSRGTRAARDVWVLELGTDPFGAQPLPEPRRLSFDNQYTTSHDWFEDGRSLVLDSERSGFRALWQLDMDGNWTLLGGRDGQSPSLGGTQLAFVIANYDANIWMLDPATGASSPQALVSSSKYDSNPNWSPDGKEIAFTSNRTGTGSLWISNADGSRQRQVYEPDTGRVVGPQWSPDGSYLLATRYDETGQNVVRVALNQREVTVIPTSGEHPYGNQVSADGSWLFYVASIGGGGTRLWRQPLDGSSAAEIVIDSQVDSFQLIDDRWILYTRLDEAGLFRMDMAQSSAGILVLDSQFARLQSGWTANRQWIYFNARTADNRLVLMRQPFDGGTPVEVSSEAATALMPSMSIHPVSGMLLQARTDRAQADLFITEAGL